MRNKWLIIRWTKHVPLSFSPIDSYINMSIIFVSWSTCRIVFSHSHHSLKFVGNVYFLCGNSRRILAWFNANYFNYMLAEKALSYTLIIWIVLFLLKSFSFHSYWMVSAITLISNRSVNKYQFWHLFAIIWTNILGGNENEMTLWLGGRHLHIWTKIQPLNFIVREFSTVYSIKYGNDG